MTRSVVLETKLSVSALNSNTRIASRRIARSMDNYSSITQVLATDQVFPEFSIDTFLEVFSQHPITIGITHEGEAQQVIKVHNYFIFTPPADTPTDIEITNTHTGDNEVRLFIA